MRKSIFIFFLVVMLGLIITGCSKNSSDLVESSAQTVSNVIETKSTGSTGSGDVLIELTPHEVVNGNLEVDIATNTHFVDLAQFDLKEIAYLEFAGNKIKPTEAPVLTGHHSSGKLLFKVGNNLAEYTITIVGIPMVEQRSYTWGT